MLLKGIFKTFALTVNKISKILRDLGKELIFPIRSNWKSMWKNTGHTFCCSTCHLWQVELTPPGCPPSTSGKLLSEHPHLACQSVLCTAAFLPKTLSYSSLSAWPSAQHARTWWPQRRENCYLNKWTNVCWSPRWCCLSCPLSLHINRWCTKATVGLLTLEDFGHKSYQISSTRFSQQKVKLT